MTEKKVKPCSYGPAECECHKCRLHRQEATIERLKAKNEELRDALAFIAGQKDKVGNWAVELAKRTLAAQAAGGES